MPTGNPTADAITRGADRKAEGSVRDIFSQGFMPDVNISPTLDSKSYVQQSTDILKAGMNNPALTEMFGRVEDRGRQASNALNIIDEQFKQKELSKLPLDALQKEVDDLETRRARVLPELLSDDSIVDFNAKLRLSSMLQGMFDREIDNVIDKKKSLETAAEARAKTKADTMRAQASMLDKQLQNDQYLLSNAIDMFQAGTGSLQDILQYATQMEADAAKRAEAGKGDGNPFVGLPGQSFTDYEISQFLFAEKNGGMFNISDSAGENKKGQLTQRYMEWQNSGKPVRVPVRASGPATKQGSVPTTMGIFSADTEGVNKFPNPKPGFFDLLGGTDTGVGRPVGEAQ